MPRDLLSSDPGCAPSWLRNHNRGLNERMPEALGNAVRARKRLSSCYYWYQNGTEPATWELEARWVKVAADLSPTDRDVISRRVGT